jgi:E3 ubiquitin-protein ligase FANCL
MLAPVNKSLTEYMGVVSAFGSNYRVAIQQVEEEGRGLRPCGLSLDEELHRLLSDAGMMSTLCARLKQGHTPEELMEELRHATERVLRAKRAGVSTLASSLPAEMYPRIVKELEGIGWNHLVSMDGLLESLILRATDQERREHQISVRISKDYPREAPSCSASLPRALQLQWSSDCTLSNVLHQFQLALSPYQQFWSEMDDLDRKAWILEPENPSRAATERRVAVAPHCSIMLTVDPLNPRSAPQLRFLGAENIIAPLRAKCNINLHKWNVNLALRVNLESMLELTLPSSKSAGCQPEDFSGACAICYQYRLADAGKGPSRREGAIPDKICDNPKCRQAYHPACLCEWLQTLPDTRISFGTMFGACVYCGEDISTTQ